MAANAERGYSARDAIDAGLAIRWLLDGRPAEEVQDAFQHLDLEELREARHLVLGLHVLFARRLAGARGAEG